MIKTLWGNHFCLKYLVCIGGWGVFVLFHQKKGQEMKKYWLLDIVLGRNERSRDSRASSQMDAGTGLAQFSVSRENFTHLPGFSSYHILAIFDYTFLLFLILPLTRLRLGVNATTQTQRSRQLFLFLSLIESIFFLCFLPALISLTGASEWVTKFSLLGPEELRLLP